MKKFSIPVLAITLVILATFSTPPANATTYNINTLAGKVASVNNTPGLYLQMSGFLQQEADTGEQAGSPSNPAITPTFVLSSPLDASTIAAPDVTVNQDTAAASQNEPAVAVDPNNANRIVAAANDYVTRTWTCTISGTPCSALGDGYSGTYYSNDGGATWCCVATSPSSIGTLIPGVERLVGGIYDAGGDPAVAFDSAGHVYYAGLGFDRTAPPNTVAVNKGTFSGGGTLTWGPPTFINPTTSPAIFNDKEWIAADYHSGSPFQDRVYVSWTRFIFNPVNGMYVQSPIFFAFSTDGGATFSTPQLIVGNVLYDQGSRPVVAPDGTVYVFWDGATRLATLDSIWVTKSTDGGENWSPPVAVSPLVDILTPKYAAFRVNSFPAADAAPNGDLYVAWSSMESDTTSLALCPTFTNTGCHAAAFYSKSTTGGATWSAPALVFPTLDASTRTAVGYPVTQPIGGATFSAPAARRVDTFFPGVAISSSGRVYMSAYAADVVSPWQTCASPIPPPQGRINCLALGNYINNARLDYAVNDLTTATSNIVTTNPINTRYHFGGGFIGDYTGIAVGSNNMFHAVWADTNNVQTVVWWYGLEFVPTSVHQQDIATDANSF